MSRVVYRNPCLYPTVDLQALTEGLEIGFEELDNMMNMHSVLLSARESDGYIPYHVRKVATCSIESFNLRYGIEEEEKTDADKTAPKSDDGIMKTIEKIITKIIDTIKEIWKSIMNLLGAGEPDAKKAAEADKETKDAVAKTNPSDWVKTEWEKNSKRMIWYLNQNYISANIEALKTISDRLLVAIEGGDDKSMVVALKKISESVTNTKSDDSAGIGDMITGVGSVYLPFQESAKTLTEKVKIDNNIVEGIEDIISLGDSKESFGGIILCKWNSVVTIQIKRSDEGITTGDVGSKPYTDSSIENFKVDKDSIQRALENSEEFSKNFKEIHGKLKKINLGNASDKVEAALKVLESNVKNTKNDENIAIANKAMSAIRSMMNVVSKVMISVTSIVNGSGGMLIETDGLRKAINRNLKNLDKTNDDIEKLKKGADGD